MATAKKPAPRCARCKGNLTKARVSKRKRTCYRCEVKAKRESAERAREARYAKMYGLRPGEYRLIYDAQGGRCAICPRAIGRTKRLAVDHDHKTGLVRGLLCSVCNRHLGHIRDDVETAQRIVQYLLDPPAQRVRQGMGKRD